MSMLSRLTLLAALLLSAGGAEAQQIQLDTSPALRCLTPASDVERQPEYPFDAWKNDLGGRVQVALEFTVADGAPAVTVLMRDGSEHFVDSVRRHVRGWRVPCLAEVGGSTRLTFDFVFVPDTRKVTWASPQDSSDARRRAMIGCIKHLRGDKAPEYSIRAQEQRVRGNVFVTLRFTAPNLPPEAVYYAHRDARPLLGATQAWVDDLRMPCIEGGAVDSTMVMVYRFEGDRAAGFKPLTLPQFMSFVKDIGRQTIAFDTRTMGCPFEIDLYYLRPQAPNRIGQVGHVDPARQPLFDWLAQTELQVPREIEAAIYADKARITIPCVKIDLKPKE